MEAGAGSKQDGAEGEVKLHSSLCRETQLTREGALVQVGLVGVVPRWAEMVRALCSCLSQ